MGNSDYKKKKNKGFKPETSTLKIGNLPGSIISKTIDNENNNGLLNSYDLVSKIVELENKYNDLATQTKRINSNIDSIRCKENRLLNRFGWTLIMANVLLGILCGITVLGYFQFIYPELKKYIENEGTFEFISYIIFAIIGLLFTTWVSVLKFADYIKKRDQGENK